ncbi:MAG: cation:proton antiporter [Spirochaetaceae bacterium]|jgi:Kef-type K+ transport system membrane component KefB|nr:cation:proton antiporter [Spirochaetaceae bacterium]
MNIVARILPDSVRINEVTALNLTLLAGLMLLFGSASAKLFQRLKLPQVVGYIIIGIVIGQSGLQLLGPDVSDALAPINSMALALIGFMIGAELKISVIKKYGRQFVSILLFEAVTPFILVGLCISIVSLLITGNLALSLSLGLILGSISSATAPAATTDVLKENRTRGPLTTTLLGIVAMDDAVALILYAISSSLVAVLTGSVSVSLGGQLLTLTYTIGVSTAVGLGFGFVLSILNRTALNDEGRILAFSLGAIFLCAGVCDALSLNSILAMMAMGFFLVNYAPPKMKTTFALVDKFTPPVYVLFFVLVGAKLNIWNISTLTGLLALVYVFARTIGKSIGAVTGARLSQAPRTVQKYMPFCLLSQAGVAIGLSITAGRDYASSFGGDIVLIITATTFIVQLIGPVCVKYGVTGAGECGLNLIEEDILKLCSASDVARANRLDCSAGCPAVVTETASIRSIIDSFSHFPNTGYAVKNSSGALTGVITVEHLKDALAISSEFSDSLLACDLMDPIRCTCRPDTSLAEVYELFDRYAVDIIPITDTNNTALGVIEEPAVYHFVREKVTALHQKADGDR